MSNRTPAIAVNQTAHRTNPPMLTPAKTDGGWSFICLGSLPNSPFAFRPFHSPASVGPSPSFVPLGPCPSRTDGMTREHRSRSRITACGNLLVDLAVICAFRIGTCLRRKSDPTATRTHANRKQWRSGIGPASSIEVEHALILCIILRTESEAQHRVHCARKRNAISVMTHLPSDLCAVRRRDLWDGARWRRD